jgi:ribosomal-protein-alanine N-acetyltransferase
MTVRLATREDLDALWKIESEEHSSGWNIHQLAKEFDTPVSRIWVDETHGQFRGFLVGWFLPGESQVVHVVVAHRDRRQGVASGLMEVFLKHSAAVSTLEVRKKNEPARAFYRRYGFQEVGGRPCYYQNPEDDAVLMERCL